MAGTRFLIAGIITFAFLFARGARLPSRPHWRSAFILGALLLVGGNGFVTWSEREVPSGIAALVIATVPLWVTLFDWLIFQAPVPGRRMIAGLILGFLGIGLLIGGGQFQGTSNVRLISVIVLLMAPILWSLGSLKSRNADLPQNAFMSTAMEMLAGGLLLIIAGLITGEARQLNVAQIAPRSLVAMLYLTFFGSIVALTAYVWLLKTVEAAKVATYSYVNPAIAVFLGWLILSEPVTPQILAAIVVIILGVILITTSSRAKKRPVPEPPALVKPSQVKSSPKKTSPGESTFIGD
jgi:drug/metabolite transporter (DMT)-like permease